ncbi:hypothetical protein [Microcoleus sp. S13_C5]|uniref:hypothetical protein n=1 Tax=Microcoleus sp. S13_C5 TaxID=3055411 RepID=UPI002FD4219C
MPASLLALVGCIAIAHSGDAVPETAPEITPEMPPTPSSAKYGKGVKPSETGQSAGIVNLSGI